MTFPAYISLYNSYKYFADANQFIKGMDQFVDVVEREKHVFNVEVKDPGAPVDFFINGKKVSKTDERCEYVNLGEGKHQLIIHHIKMEDLGTIEAKTPSNRGDQMLTSSTAFDVTKGEEAPEIGATGPVTGVAFKDCCWKVPYKVRKEGSEVASSSPSSILSLLFFAYLIF